MSCRVKYCFVVRGRVTSRQLPRELVDSRLPAYICSACAVAIMGSCEAPSATVQGSVC